MQALGWVVCRAGKVQERQSNKHAEFGLSEAGPRLSILRTATVRGTHPECRAPRQRFEVIRVRKAAASIEAARRSAQRVCLILKPARQCLVGKTGQGD